MKIPFSNILVYFDGSEEGDDALDYALSLAGATGVKLHAVYVINTKAVGVLLKKHVFVSGERDEYLGDLKKDAEKRTRYANRIAERKGVKIITEIGEGAPHKVIEDYIKANGIDLLVLGAVNEIRSRRDEITSENDRLLRTSSCPVLIVKR